MPFRLYAISLPGVCPLHPYIYRSRDRDIICILLQNGYPFIATFFLQSRGERFKVIRYHDPDIRT